MPLVDYLNQLNYYDGSDLHLVSGVVAGIRQYGKVLPLEAESMTAEHATALLREIVADEGIERLRETKNMDFAFEAETDAGVTRYRGNCYLQMNGPSVVLRRIPLRAPTIEELGMPTQVLRRLTQHHQGMILATGPAGCGKTTTVAAMVNYINEHRACHILTLEDPIEYVFTNKRALVNQRQVGRDVESFATGLRGALREDPDVIVIGELRDLETVSLAVTAAETGHVVFGTMHTQSAPKTVDRIIDAFPVEQQPQIRTMLAESLRGVITQQLVPRADGHGRVAAVEILLSTPSVGTLIRESRTFQIPYIMETNRKIGMRSFDDSLMELHEQGVINKEEAAARSSNKDVYEKKSHAAGFQTGFLTEADGNGSRAEGR